MCFSGGLTEICACGNATLLTHQNTATIWVSVKDFVGKYPDLPMICMGDLNNIMSHSEKKGPRPANSRRISNFCGMVKDCGFFDLGYNRPGYTWTNKRFNTNPTYQRLDHFSANAEWCTKFPTTTVYHLPMMSSDHAPILAVLNSNRARIKNLFVSNTIGCLKMILNRWQKRVGNFRREDLFTRSYPSSPLIVSVESSPNTN
jgi:hypothetical protein